MHSELARTDAPMLCIPPEDWPVYEALPKACKARIDRYLPVFAALLALRTGKGITARQAAGALGISLQRVNNLLTACRKQGWRALIDNRALGRATQKVPAIFLPFWHGYVLANQRNTRRAHARLISDAVRGKAVPGFETWRHWPQVPPGLTYGNLIKDRYMPTDAVVALGRSGIAAARKFLPCVHQDVSEVRPLEYILFDDVELDFLVSLVPGQPAVKLRLIVAFDLCSRRILGYGVRPAITRADGVEDSLKLRDMKAVVVRLLRSFGIPTGYRMHFICERGTAAIKEPFALAIHEATRGMVETHDTSMIAGRVLGYADGSVGNSWGKAWLESFFNLLHGELAHLDGQKGRRYDLAPRELEGRKKEVLMLAGAMKHIPVGDRYRFRIPFITLDDAISEFESALDRMSDRTDHELQGFSMVQLWKTTPNDLPKPMHELPMHLMDRMEHLLFDTRIESPRERWERLIVDCPRTFLHESVFHVLLSAHTEPVRFQNYSFRFESEGRKYIYFPDPGLLPLLTEGQQYLVWMHPQDMGNVYLTRCAPHLGYVGKLTQFQRVRKGDVEAAEAALAQATRAMSDAKMAAKDVRLDQIHRRMGDAELNAELTREATAHYESERDAIILPSEGEHEDAPGIAARMTRDDVVRRAAASNERQAKAFGAVLRKCTPEAAPEAAPVEAEVWPDRPAQESPNPNPQPDLNPDLEVW